VKTKEDLKAKQQALLEVLKREAFKRGNFVLSSGQTSNWYYDGRMTMGDPEGAALTGQLIFEILRDTDVQAVGGPASGAISIGCAVSMASYGTDRPMPNFWVREETKSHGTQKIIEAQFPKEKGAKVAIVEDTMTTGGSVLRAIEQVEEEGAVVEYVVVIMDRRAGGSEKLRSQGYKVISLYEATEDGEPYVVELKERSDKS